MKWETPTVTTLGPCRNCRMPARACFDRGGATDGDTCCASCDHSPVVSDTEPAEKGDPRQPWLIEAERRTLIDAFHLFRCIDGGHNACAEAAHALLAAPVPAVPAEPEAQHDLDAFYNAVCIPDGGRCKCPAPPAETREAAAPQHLLDELADLNTYNHELLDEIDRLRAALASPPAPGEPETRHPVEVWRDAVAAYQAQHVQPREDITSVRGPGWYEADCDTCGWHTSGYESNVDDWSWEHAAEHVGPPPAAPGEGTDRGTAR